jgi:hypothetical protein
LNGWYLSIVGMMAAPFVLIGIGGFAFWRASKRRRPDASADPAPESRENRSVPGD